MMAASLWEGTGGYRGDKEVENYGEAARAVRFSNMRSYVK